MLQQLTLDFLAGLAANNNKPWFEENRSAYIAAKSDTEKLITRILKEFGEKDADVANLVPKDCTYRINRDVRFSNNKSPYKPNMGAYMVRGGKKSPFAGYYLHVEAGNKSFFGGGIYMPETLVLKKIRQEIAYCFEEFQGIVEAEDFKKFMGDVEVAGHKLVKVPQGYDANHAAAEYLKMKSIFTIRKLSDAQLTDPATFDLMLKGFSMVLPMIKFFNRAVAD